MSEMPTDERLISAALDARDRAYAPYSNYRVGCVAVAGGQVFVGANVENASYGLCTCAERTAALQAVMDGQRAFETVVVATQSSPPAAPCGLCLQTLIEFAPDPAAVRVILVNTHGERADYTLDQLLPHAFRPAHLDG